MVQKFGLNRHFRLWIPAFAGMTKVCCFAKFEAALLALGDVARGSYSWAPLSYLDEEKHGRAWLSPHSAEIIRRSAYG